jgi:hypothetical protein
MKPPAGRHPGKGSDRWQPSATPRLIDGMAGRLVAICSGGWVGWATLGQPQHQTR